MPNNTTPLTPSELAEIRERTVIYGGNNEHYAVNDLGLSECVPRLLATIDARAGEIAGLREQLADMTDARDTALQLADVYLANCHTQAQRAETAERAGRTLAESDTGEACRTMYEHCDKQPDCPSCKLAWATAQAREANH